MGFAGLMYISLPMYLGDSPLERRAGAGVFVFGGEEMGALLRRGSIFKQGRTGGEVRVVEEEEEKGGKREWFTYEEIGTTENERGLATGFV